MNQGLNATIETLNATIETLKAIDHPIKYAADNINVSEF